MQHSANACVCYFICGKDFWKTIGYSGGTGTIFSLLDYYILALISGLQEHSYP